MGPDRDHNRLPEQYKLELQDNHRETLVRIELRPTSRQPRRLLDPAYRPVRVILFLNDPDIPEHDGIAVVLKKQSGWAWTFRITTWRPMR